ncbi:MAG: leucine-rich repeat domain-containing protein [Propionibacteriaceae bacterium]|nr:leucine-rich repeat domain-containing protein [Propionibacteriaceae bacterium]
MFKSARGIVLAFATTITMTITTCIGFTPVPAQGAGLVPDQELRLCIAHTLGAMNPDYAQGTPAFDQVAAEVTQEHLQALSKAQRLACAEGVDSLEGLQHIPDPSLTILHIDKGNIKNLEPIAGLTKLTDLSLREHRISTVAPLAELTALTELDIAGNVVDDLGPIAGLTKLAKLDITENMVEDISSLAGMTKLTSLDAYKNQISDITPLAELKLLVELDLYGNNVTDISPLSKLTNIYDLDLGANAVTDFTPLASLPNLQVLGLAQSGIDDLSAVTKLTKIGDLDLANNKIVDITPLAGMKDLHFLDLSGNNIADVTVLAKMMKAGELRLHNNAIEDLTPIAENLNCVGASGAPCLVWTLEGNAITDISMLDPALIEQVWMAQTDDVFGFSSYTVANQVVTRELTKDEKTTLPELVLAESDTAKTTWVIGPGSAAINESTGEVTSDTMGVSLVEWTDGRGFFTGALRVDKSLTNIEGKGKAVHGIYTYVLYGIGGLGMLLMLIGFIMLIGKSRKSRHGDDTDTLSSPSEDLDVGNPKKAAKAAAKKAKAEAKAAKKISS